MRRSSPAASAQASGSARRSAQGSAARAAVGARARDAVTSIVAAPMRAWTWELTVLSIRLPVRIVDRAVELDGPMMATSPHAHMSNCAHRRVRDRAPGRSRASGPLAAAREIAPELERLAVGPGSEQHRHHQAVLAALQLARVDRDRSA